MVKNLRPTAWARYPVLLSSGFINGIQTSCAGASPRPHGCAACGRGLAQGYYPCFVFSSNLPRLTDDFKLISSLGLKR